MGRRLGSVLDRLLTLLLRLSPFVFFAFFTFLILGSNASHQGYDWDFFFTTFEVDRRAWILDRTFPTWSYQFCGGATRIGDAQSFGLSPLFIFTLMFGPIWGAKILVLFCALTGFIYAKKIGLLYLSSKTNLNSTIESQSATLLAILLVFGNFFLWHMHVGHVTYAVFYLAIGLFYYSLKSINEILSFREWLCGTLLTFLIFSGAFFQVSVYYLIPFIFAFVVTVIVQLAFCFLKKAPLWPIIKKHFRANSFYICGVLLSAYRIVPAFLYQGRYPRGVHPYPEDGIPLIKEATGQLLPTAMGFGADTFKGLIGSFWETDTFCLTTTIGMLCVMALLVEECRKKWATQRSSMQSKAESQTFPFLQLFSLILLAVGFSFAAGNSSRWTLHTLFSEFVYGYIARNLSRYGGIISFAITLCTLGLLKRLLKLHWNSLVPRLVAVIFSILGLYPLSWLSGQVRAEGLSEFNTWWQLSRSVADAHKLKALYHQKDYDPKMMEWIKQNVGLLSCYQPLVFHTIHIPDYSGQAKAFAFLEDPQNLPKQCSSHSFFTATSIVFDPSCPDGTCVLFHGINDKDKQQMEWNPAKGRFCLKRLLNQTLKAEIRQ